MLTLVYGPGSLDGLCFWGAGGAGLRSTGGAGGLGFSLAAGTAGLSYYWCRWRPAGTEILKPTFGVPSPPRGPVALHSASGNQGG